jgi:DNA-binding LacI/PurR family transcriptional regulator
MTIDRDAREAGIPRKPGVVAVARAVGVSPSTVSNAFNRPERLSPALRERVLRTAAELGYGGPDPVARSLRSGRAGAIGVVFRRCLADAFDEPATVQLLRGLSDVTDPQQLALVLVPGLRQEHPSIGPAVRNAAVDGLIVYSMSADDPLFEAARQRQLPTVIVDSPAVSDLPAISNGLAGTGPDFVGIDDRGAAETAVRHLLDLGHRSIAVLGFGLTVHSHPGPADIRHLAQATASVSKARLEGSARAVVAAGQDWSSVPVEQVPITSVEGCLAGARALLDRAPGITALFAFSDPLALAARLAARERGLSVPGDLSIIGFDDTAPASEGLTTIHQPLRDKGRIAAERLLRALSLEPPPAGGEILPTRLVIRDSTAPPSGR